jgi:hypothetical protein
MTKTMIVRNRVRLSTILIFLTIYTVLWGIPLLVLIFTGPISLLLVNRRIGEARTDSNRFNKTFPFAAYGETFGDFEHVFFHDRAIVQDVVTRVDRSLATTFNGPTFQERDIIDADGRLSARDSRTFLVSTVGTTDRGTAITLIMRTYESGPLHAVRWWIMLGGFVDADRKARFLLASPLTFWFWIIPYLRGNVNLLGRVTSIYNAAFNDMDILTVARGLHQSVFDAMVAVLEDNEIDTSDIKIQRAQVMNISISGGKVNMGNIVQGAMNKIAARVSGGQK